MRPRGASPASRVPHERDAVVREIIRALTKRTDCGVLILGPRGSGRTTVLDCLQEALADSDGVESTPLVVRVDCREYASDPPPAMRAIGAAIARGAKVESAEPSSVAEAVGCALRAIGSKVLVVCLDNFDRIGPFMGAREQSDLRTAFYKRAGAKAIVTSCAPLDTCLEHLAEKASQAEDIVGKKTIFLRPFDARSLRVWLAREGFSAAYAEEWAPWLHEYIGGNPEWLAIAIEFVKTEANPKGRPADVEESIYLRIAPRLKRDLQHLTAKQLWILADVERKDAVEEGAAAYDWLVQSGWLTGDAKPPAVERFLEDAEPVRHGLARRVDPNDYYGVLGCAVGRLNLSRWRRGAQTEVVLEATLTSRQVQPYLCRECSSRVAAAQFVEALYQTLWTGTYGFGDKPTLPEILYSDARSPLTVLKAWTRTLARFSRTDEADWREFRVAWLKAISGFLDDLTLLADWADFDAVQEIMCRCAPTLPNGSSGAHAKAGPGSATPHEPAPEFAFKYLNGTWSLAGVALQLGAGEEAILRELVAAAPGPVTKQDLTKKTRIKYLPNALAALRDKVKRIVADDNTVRDRGVTKLQLRVGDLSAEAAAEVLVDVVLPKGTKEGYRLCLAPASE